MTVVAVVELGLRWWMRMRWYCLIHHRNYDDDGGGVMPPNNVLLDALVPTHHEHTALSGRSSAKRSGRGRVRPLPEHRLLSLILVDDR